MVSTGSDHVAIAVAAALLGSGHELRHLADSSRALACRPSKAGQLILISN